MTEEVKNPEIVEAPQEPVAEPAGEQPKTISVDDIKSIRQLRELHANSEQGLVTWAKKRIQETNYVQAVQTELAMHKGDTHSFCIAVLMNFIEDQGKRIELLENMLIKVIKNAKEN